MLKASNSSNTQLWQLAILSIVLLILSACSSTARSPMYLDENQPFTVRVDDLVSRMTLEEKVSQMQNQAPAIEHLQIPEYNWWSEALHGVARAGLATVFPQAIGLAATWDEDMMLRVATAISDEARAKHHAFAANDKRFIYQGLTLWSPNINIFRDPRWGRGQETYGEDPLLTGRMAIQFIRGLQGDDPKYLKTVATVKHYAVHSGPEPERHEFNAVTNDRDLFRFYLPQFEMALMQGGAYSLMCAYNRFNGTPACSNPYLLEGILRQQWRFNGFVVSDCGAIEDIHKYHKVTQTPEQSAAAAVKAGTDLNCGQVYISLVEAVEQGLINENTIDKSVKRLMLARMKLGMFDRPESVPYTQIPYEVVDSPAHRELALEAARKSVVLLKNKNRTLPLKKDIRFIAVIGPNADQWLMLLGNYNGVPADPITPLRGIKEKVSANTHIAYAQGSELAEGIPMLYPIPADAFITSSSNGLTAEYFANTALSGRPVFSEKHDNIDINWQDKAPREDLNDDEFSVRWRGYFTPPTTGQYQLGVISTCNTKVFLDDELVVSTPYHFRDEYGDPRTKKSSWIQLSAGKGYKIEVTAIETYADAQVQLVWARPQPDLHQQALAVAKKAEAVIMFMGLTPRMEGEEMDIDVDGFRGGDRTKLDLPNVQQQLIKDIVKLGKPTVLVLLNGSALAINWEQQNVPAIIEAWYPGQAAGQAIADVIFGDFNPGGRLPVTFYRSTEDLAPFEEYQVSTQTYRYFNKPVLYPFGYGLSYSEFQYSDLQMQRTLSAGESLEIQVSITNNSNYDGDEVIQVYLSPKEPDTNEANIQLASFKRVHIPAFGKKIVSLEISANAFSKFDNNGNRFFHPGQYHISIGGGQPHTSLPMTSNILSSTVTLEKPKKQRNPSPQL